MTDDLAPLQQRIGYQFNDKKLLVRALRHRSVGRPNNERMEFLGDAVLSTIVAEALYRHHPHAREGELSRMRSILVNGIHLAELAKDLEIGAYLHLGSGELKSGGQHRESILADALEAIIGAIYLDSNLEICQQCIFKWYGKRFDDLSELRPAKDPKSRLQEWAQAHKFSLPTYEVKVSGKPHEQTFQVICCVEGLSHIGEGSNTSRRKAEQAAARHYLELLG